MDDGSGLARLIPPVAGADYLEKNKNEVACLIRYGRKSGVIVNGIRYTEPMPGVRELSETEITNILNYIRTSWGNDLEPVTLEQVTTDLEYCPEKPSNRLSR